MYTAHIIFKALSTIQKKYSKVRYNQILMECQSYFQCQQRLSGKINEKLEKKVVTFKSQILVCSLCPCDLCKKKTGFLLCAINLLTNQVWQFFSHFFNSFSTFRVNGSDPLLLDGLKHLKETLHAKSQNHFHTNTKCNFEVSQT